MISYGIRELQKYLELAQYVFRFLSNKDNTNISLAITFIIKINIHRYIHIQLFTIQASTFKF